MVVLNNLIMFGLVQIFSVIMVCQGALKKPPTGDETCTPRDAASCSEDYDCWNQDRCCETWAAKNQCKENAEFMGTDCKAACGLCKPTYDQDAVCIDFFPVDCIQWAKDGECKKNDWMENNCRKSCKTCDLFTKKKIAEDCVMDN